MAGEGGVQFYSTQEKGKGSVLFGSRSTDDKGWLSFPVIALFGVNFSTKCNLNEKILPTLIRDNKYFKHASFYAYQSNLRNDECKIKQHAANKLLPTQ